MVGALGSSYEDAPTVARVAVGTMKSRVNRARRHLGSHLGLANGQFKMPEAEGTILAAMSTSRAHLTAAA